MPINLNLYIKEVLGEKELGEISEAFLERMDDVKDRDTMRGTSPVVGATWHNEYSDEYARKKKGGRKGPVILRDGTRDIERTVITNQGARGKALEFLNKDKARIFQRHQDGINYRKVGFRRRKIYPENMEEAPQEAHDAARIKLDEIIKRNG